MKNEDFGKAMTIIKGASFVRYVKTFAELDSLSEKEKKDVNEKMKPICIEVIQLLRKAYKNEPTNPEISWELVKILHLNHLRIAKYGTMTEKLEAVKTGFKADDGRQIMGYANMIFYHAEICSKFDTKGMYKNELPKITNIYNSIK